MVSTLSNCQIYKCRAFFTGAEKKQTASKLVIGGKQIFIQLGNILRKFKNDGVMLTSQAGWLLGELDGITSPH